MKTFTTLFFFSLAISLSAQVPNYFENNPEWRQRSDCRTGDCIDSENYVYYLDGDSVVEDLTYKKVYRHGLLTHLWYSDPPIPDWCTGSSTFNQFHALIRQEEARVYIRIWNEPEALLYDFNLKVGDTLPITWNQWNEDIVVVSIDSLQVGNSYRKVFNLTQQSSPQLIEGIGHEGGFLEPFPPILECGHNLFCYALNDTTYYPNYNDPCDLTVNIQPIKSQETIKYYPNPVTNNLTIEHNFSENFEQVVAYNTSGRKKVLVFKENAENRINIDFVPLGKGLYVVQLIGKEKVILNLKVLKE